MIGASKEPADASRGAVDAILAAWRTGHDPAVARYEKFMADLDIAAGMSVGKLSLLTEKLNELLDRTKA